MNPQKPSVFAVIIVGLLLLANFPGPASAAIHSSSTSSSSKSISSKIHHHYHRDHYSLLNAGGIFFMIIVIFGLICSFFQMKDTGDHRRRHRDHRLISVVKLQVGFLGPAISLQRDLNRIVETGDLSTRYGLNRGLTKATLAVLRNLDICVSACSSIHSENSVSGSEKRFRRLSEEERSKCDEETVANVDGIITKRSAAARWRGGGYGSKEYVVVTILAAVEGGYDQPRIISSRLDLKGALEKLGAIPYEKTRFVEVLWTPQNEYESLSEQELLRDYPLLRPSYYF